MINTTRLLPSSCDLLVVLLVFACSCSCFVFSDQDLIEEIDFFEFFFFFFPMSKVKMTKSYQEGGWISFIESFNLQYQRVVLKTIL